MTAIPMDRRRKRRPQQIHPIKRVLFEFGITQTALAHAAKVDQNILCQQLNGHRPMRPEREAWLRQHLQQLVAEAAQRNAQMKPLCPPGKNEGR